MENHQRRYLGRTEVTVLPEMIRSKLLQLDQSLSQAFAPGSDPLDPMLRPAGARDRFRAKLEGQTRVAKEEAEKAKK